MKLNTEALIKIIQQAAKAHAKSFAKQTGIGCVNSCDAKSPECFDELLEYQRKLADRHSPNYDFNRHLALLQARGPVSND